ncbi:MAG TPA: PAS domain S-box protein [Dehalococcoidia bacterium]|nr:PAS domain S-box protein [Dehalococcoidia bacterium]
MMETASRPGRITTERFEGFCAQIVEEIHDAVVATDLDGVVTNWNRGAVRLFGYDADEALGRHVSFVYPEDQHRFLQESVIAPLKAHGTREVEVRMRRKSGEDFLAHLALSMIRESNGKPIGMVGYSQDITAQTRATEALETRLRQSAAVAHLGQLALQGGDFTHLLQEAVSLVAENLNVEYAKVLELLPDGRNFLLRAGIGWREGRVGDAIVSGGKESQAGYTLQSNEPVIVEDLRTETRFSGPALLSDHGVVSGISVIILGRDKPYGVLGAHTAHPRRFTAAGIDFLQSMANVLAAAVQRREAEQTLLESEQRFRQLAEHVEETFWMTDFESGQVLYVSPRFEQTWGSPLNSVYENPEAWLGAIVPEDRGRVAESYVPERLAQGEFDEQYRISRPDGSIRWIRDRGYPIRDDLGRVVRIAGIAQDVTIQKESEEALRRQSELLDIAHDAILVRDLTTRRISYWNKAAESLYGWSSDEAVGQLPEDLLATKYPQPLPEIESRLNKTGHWRGEIIQQRRDGTSIVVHTEWVLQRDQRGEPLALMQLNEQVDTEGPLPSTELERLVALVDTSPVAIVAVDAMGEVLFADKEALELFGLQLRSHEHLERFEEAAAMRRPEGEAYERDAWPLRRALLTGEHVRAEEIAFEFRDGRSVTALVNATPFFGFQGRITAAVVTLQDLSPLEQLEKMRNEFLGVVSHELKTPLTVIKGAAALALKDDGKSDQFQTREFFEMISEQADRLQELIGNLHDSARIESGSFSVDPEPNDLSSILEEAVKSFRRSGISGQVDLDQPSSLPRVLADKQRITQVLHNLLNNAAKYSPAGSPISISAQHDGLYVTVRVRDRGPGIDEAKLPLLFKKYSRIHQETQKTPGSGLGLYICKGIIETHGGRIWVENGRGDWGATFSFTLPVAPESAIPEAISSRSSGLAPSPVRQLTNANKRILAIDDDWQVLRLLRRTLQESGFDASVTSDPEQVTELIDSKEPSLIILDLTLPRISGFDVLKRIREFSSIPVIFLTASEREEDLVRALKLGADDYISKPFSPSELIARIEACIRAHSHTSPTENRLPFHLEDLTVDFPERRVLVGEEVIQLSASEYRLLYELVTNPGRVLTHDQLLLRVWGEAYAGELELLRSLVRRLRRKLRDDARHPRFIFNEPQVGYRMPKP